MQRMVARTWMRWGLVAGSLLAAQAQGQPTIGSVLNGAFTAAIAPGSGISLFGTSFATSTCQATPGTTWTTSLCSAQVLLNGTPIPLGFVSPGQINAQVPYTTATGPATLQVVSSPGSSAIVQITIAALAPSLNPSPGVLHNATFQPANAGNPAVLGPGDPLRVFGFGFGPTSPPQPAGVPVLAAPFPALASPPTLYVDGVATPATFQSAGLSSGTPGLYEFVFTINSLPAAVVADGTHTLSIGVGGAISNGVPFVIQGPSFAPGSVVNGFTIKPTLAAGGLSSIYGVNLAGGTCQTPAGQNAATTLCDAQVLVNGAAAPVIFASPGQLNFQVPFGIAGTTVSIQARRAATNRLSAIRYNPLQATAPGLGTACQCGSGLGTFFKSNFTQVTAANPAVPGETLSLFAGGLGPTTPAVTEGVRAPSGANTASAAAIFIDGVPAKVTTSALQPNAIGQYSVQFEVPSAALPGTKPLLLSIAGYTSQVVDIPISGGLAWVANDSGVVNTIDTSTNAIIGSAITVHNNDTPPFATPASGTRRLAQTPDGTRVYVNRTVAGGHVWVIDTRTRAANALNIPVTGRVFAVSPDGKRAYQPGTDVLNVFGADPASQSTYHQLLGTFSLPGINSIAFSPDGRRLYATTNGSPNGSLAVLDILTGPPYLNQIATVTGLGSDLPGLAVTPDGSRVYVVNRIERTVSTINTSTNAEAFPRIVVTLANNVIAIAPNGKRAYVNNTTTSPLTVIDIDPQSGATYNTVLTSVATAISVADIGVSADSSKVYTASRASGAVRVVDAATNALGAAITVPNGPNSLAVSRPLNTPIGANAIATPTDSTTGASPVNMTFSSVTSGGTTTLTTTTSAPPAPSGFQVAGTTYNIATTAAFTSPVTVCIGYTPADFPPPATPRLLHYEGGAWVDVTSSVNAAQSQVCGTVDSFSPFATAKADATPPVVAVVVSPPANAAGWHKTDPTVNWSSSDPESGIATSLGCSNTTQSTETPAAVFNCTVISGAGRSTGPVSVTVKLDKTPPNPPNPTVAPAPNAAGWSRANVSVTFTQAGDAGGVQSGVTTCSPGGAVSTETAGTLLQGTCGDTAGNVSTPALVMVKIDQTAPAVSAAQSPAPNANGWNNSAVTVAFTCADALSGVAAGPTPPGVLFSTEGAGQAASSSCTDVAGNSSVGALGGIKIDQTAPIVGVPSANPSVVPAGSGFVLSVTAADALSGLDSVAYNIDGGPFSNPLTLGAGEWSATVAPLAAGLHTLCIQAADKAGNTASNCTFVPVFDSQGGFVTGGGWIESPAGSYLADALLSGKASFGFVARYQKGANVPSGDTQFAFRAAGLEFVSTAYEWLVVAGARAQFKGTGTINGAGNYTFLLTAIDGDLLGVKKADAFRIKIIDNGGGVIYDNQRGKSEAGDDATGLGGGSIVIHKP